MLQGIWKKHHRVTRVTTGNITTFMTSKRFIQKGKRAARASALTKRLSYRLILSFHLRGHSGPGPLHRVLTNLGVLARALGTVCPRGPWPEALPPTANSRSKCFIFYYLPTYGFIHRRNFWKTRSYKRLWKAQQKSSSSEWINVLMMGDRRWSLSP